MDDHAGIRAHSVQFGVDVDGGGDVPAAAHHGGVLVDHADVGGGQLLPPQSPRVDEHVGAALRLPGDVPGHVLGEADGGQVPERDGHRLFVGEVDADRRGDRRRPHLQPAPAHLTDVSWSSPTRVRISSRSWPLATLPPDDRGSSSSTMSRSGSSSFETPWARRCSTSPGRSRTPAVGRCYGLDVHADLLAEHRVGHCHGCGHGHGRMRGHGILDLDRTDVLAAAQDEVRRAAGDRQVAVGVELADVAHPHPAVLGVQLVVVGAAQIAEAGGRAAAGRLPAARRGHVAIAVEQAHLHLRHDPAGGAQPAIRESRGVVPLSRPVSLEP